MNDKLMTYVKNHLDEITEISVSTNITGYLDTPYGKVIVKIHYLNEDTLSPFWKKMEFLFSSNFEKQRTCMNSLLAILSKNPHIPCPKLLGVDEDLKISVFSFMGGDIWEPDEFPKNRSIEEQLGCFIGYNHCMNVDAVELPGAKSSDEFPKRLRDFLLQNVKSDKLPNFCKNELDEDFHTDGYVLMMADISANQFLFNNDSISAIVDFDAYVIGPLEWELELIELCISDIESLKKGYEVYRNYPDMHHTRGLYDFVMNLDIDNH